MSSIAGKITKFTKQEINYLFQHARRVLRHPAFIVLLSPAQLDFARVLIVTSRKMGNASERNKIRRRIKSIFYQEKMFNGSFDWVIIVHKKAVDLSFAQLRELMLGMYIRKVCSQEDSRVIAE